MQTTPRNETGRATHHGDPTHMQTGADSHPAPALAQRLPRPLSPRQARVLSALLQGPQTREQIDRAAGASNGPDVVLKLRRRVGLVIPVTFSQVRDRDGRPVERGTYALTGPDHDKAEAFLLALATAGRAAA